MRAKCLTFREYSVIQYANLLGSYATLKIIMFKIEKHGNIYKIKNT